MGTIYCKEDENGNLFPVYNGYNGIVGIADNIELCLEHGFVSYDFDSFIKLQAGKATYADGIIIDISETTTCINAQKVARKAGIASEYKDLFKELDITYSGKVSRGLVTSQAYTTARTALQLELVTKLSEV